jgi:hypothetical protein
LALLTFFSFKLLKPPSSDDGRRERTLMGKGREQAAAMTAGEGMLTGKGREQVATTTAGEGGPVTY